MAMTGVMRPGFVQIRVLDLDEAIAHYEGRMGLELVSREADDRAYLRAYDEFDRHSIVLRKADSPGMDVMGFKVATDADLANFEARLRNKGLEVTEVPAGEQPGMGRRLRFSVATGHSFDLYSECARSENGPMTDNPDIWRSEPKGMRIVSFDHCLLYGVDIDATAAIFVECLDFVIAEQAVDPGDGTKIAIFMTCSNKAHDIALVRFGEDDKFHHVSFNLESWADIGHAADLIARYDMSLDIGPTRHGITRGQTIYFFDPSGNRNEVFTGGYVHHPDTPLRQWTMDQAGKAIFYYEKELNDRFMGVVT